MLALSLGIQPGVELADRAARRLSSPEQHAAANEEPAYEAHLTSVCLPARASPVASQPRGKQTSRPVRTGTSKECRRREAVLNSAARDTSQPGRILEGDRRRRRRFSMRLAFGRMYRMPEARLVFRAGTGVKSFEIVDKSTAYDFPAREPASFFVQSMGLRLGAVCVS